MDLVKKNWISILFGVIAIAAIISVFYPMSGKFEELRTKAQARAAVNGELKSLASRERKQPVLEVPVGNAPIDAKTLAVFPTEKVIAAGKAATEKLAAGAAALQAEVVKLNVHQPLVAGALPGEASNKTPLINFARAYNDALPVPAEMANPERRKGSIGVTILNGAIPPTDQDITREKELKRQEILRDAFKDGQGNILNQQTVEAEINAVQATVADTMRRDAAEKSLVYLNPDTFSIYPNILVGMAPDPSAIFAAQVGLWTQEDFCKAVRAINSLPLSDGSKPKNVMDAPIKQIVKITIPQSAQALPFVGVAQTTVDPNAPPPPPADPNAPVTKNTGLSPTGRVSNAMYDVVQFDVEMNVEADKLPMILEELTRGQFMTVVQVVSITAVDSSLYHSMGFFFGNKPIVKVQLKIEDLFLREWLIPLMPPAVRQKLGVAPPATPPA